MTSDPSATLFRGEALKCRQVSEAMESRDKRDHWLRLAEDYERMAEEAERRAAK
jgi:hypothetical protein